MTKKQRAQVVELLRCAADCRYSVVGTARDLWELGYPITQDIADAALAAWWSVPSRDDFVQSCLEAAQRVEEFA